LRCLATSTPLATEYKQKIARASSARGWPRYPACAERGQSAEGNRAIKLRLVDDGQAHAAVVFDGDEAVAWCQYGSPEELPNITHRREVEAAGDPPPDYRITCFFVDRRYRRKGMAGVALRGALDLIALAGGGEEPLRDAQNDRVIVR